MLAIIRFCHYGSFWGAGMKGFRIICGVSNLMIVLFLVACSQNIPPPQNTSQQDLPQEEPLPTQAAQPQNTQPSESPQQEPKPSEPPETVLPPEIIVSFLPEEPWTVELRMSGGFEGLLMRSIWISSSGEVIVFDEKTNKSFDPGLSDEVFDRIRAQVVQIAKIPRLTDQNCMDCYQYELDIYSGDAEFQTTFTDIDLAESEISPLIAELRNILNSSFQ